MAEPLVDSVMRGTSEIGTTPFTKVFLICPGGAEFILNVANCLTPALTCNGRAHTLSTLHCR